MKFSYDIINCFVILFLKKKFPRGKGAKILSIQIYNKHQEDTFNYKRRKNIYEKKKFFYIFVRVERQRNIKNENLY